MKIKLLLLLALWFPGLALSASGYEVSVTVKNARSELVFPAFKIKDFDKKATSNVGDCTYSGKLSKHDKTSISLKGEMSCINEQGDSYMNMPILVLGSKGDSASIELGDDEKKMWQYSVKIKVINGI